MLDSDSGNNLEESTDYVTVIDDVIVEDEDKLVIGVPEYFTAENRSQRKVHSFMSEWRILKVSWFYLAENGQTPVYA